MALTSLPLAITDIIQCQHILKLKGFFFSFFNVFLFYFNFFMATPLGMRD